MATKKGVKAEREQTGPKGRGEKGAMGKYKTQ